MTPDFWGTGYGEDLEGVEDALDDPCGEPDQEDNDGE
jgi:hypothetical protein